MNPEMPPIREMITVSFNKKWVDLSDFSDAVPPAPGSDKDVYLKRLKALEERCDKKFYLEKYHPRNVPITGKDLQEKMDCLTRREQDVDKACQDAYWEWKRRHE